MKNISIGFNVLGLLFLIMGVFLIISAISSSDWNQVEGTIVNSKIGSQLEISNLNTYTRKNDQIQYYIKVLYQYHVDGVTYQNSRFSIGEGDSVKGGFNEKNDASEWLSQSIYKKGNKVTVYVNPNDPEKTVLSKGFNFYTLIPIIMSLVCFGFAFMIKCIAKKATENSEKT